MKRNQSAPNFQKKEYLEVLKTFAGALVWLNEDGSVMYASSSFLQQLNLQRDEVEGKNWTDIDQSFSPVIFQQVWDKLCVDGLTDWETNLQIGENKFQALVEARIVQNDLCQLGCLRISLVQKNNPDNQLLHVLTKATQTVGWFWGFQSGKFHLTDSFFSIFKIDKSQIELKNSNIIQLLQPYLDNDQLEQLKEDFQLLRRSQKSINLDWKLNIEEERKKVVFQATPIIENEKVVGAKGILREVPKKYIKRRIQNMASQVLDYFVDLVLVLDKDFSIVHANNSSVKKLGYDTEEFENHLPIFKIDIENSSTQWSNFFKKVKTEKSLTFLTSFQRSDATIFPVEVLLSYYDDIREDFLIYLVARDISETRKTESILSANLAQQTSIAQQLEAEKAYLQKESTKNFKFENIISISKKYQPILQQVHQVAPTNSTVLIEGETGTGKELIAQAIHQLSQREKRTMIKINCASLPRELIESELFGHEKGAFTGAIQQKKGRFELAHQSSLFLDEIGELPLELQSRLLRVLQEGEFERVGGNKTIQIDVRIIAATNRKLLEMVEQGTFRQDLYYRLNVFPINNIPLRERREDIELLTWYFLKKYCKKINRDIKGIDTKDLSRLKKYDFPGNIRELENIIERSVIISNGSNLNLDFWNPSSKKNTTQSSDGFPTLEELQRVHIMDALEKTKWRISGEDGAARLLGLKDQTLFSKMRKFGISRNN